MNAKQGPNLFIPPLEHPARFLLLESTLEAYEVEEIDTSQVFDLFPEIIAKFEKQDEVELSESLLGFDAPCQNYPTIFLFLGSTLEAYEVEEIDPIQVFDLYPKTIAKDENDIKSRLR